MKRSLLLVILLVGAARGYDDAIDSPMYRRPDLPPPAEEFVFPKGLPDLWYRALERPEVEMRCKAAEAFASARRQNYKGLDKAPPALAAAFDRADDAALRLALADALIVFEARDAAPALLRAAQMGNSDLRERIEPALALWDHKPARDLWLTRLRDAATPPRNLRLAVHCLGAVREEKATDRLRELVLSPRVAGPLRLEAARAWSQIHDKGGEKDAESLAFDPVSVGRLCAAALLQRHVSAEAIALLQRLAHDAEPAVVSLAAGRLIAVDARHALPVLDALLQNADAGVRLHGVETLFLLPTGPHLRLLADRLDDEHPGVRVRARTALRDLGRKKELLPGVIAETARLLAEPSWRGQEQAAILLAQLDHKPAVERLIELLNARRGEVLVSAAWALRVLDVPDTLPRVATQVERRLVAPDRTNWIAVDHQMSQLNQFLGQRRYAPADALLRRFVPKVGAAGPDPKGPESRSAGIWALGMIHEDKADEALAAQLDDRLRDNASIPPEDTRVRAMAAVALGRMKAKAHLDSLRLFFNPASPNYDLVAYRCGWAIAAITGEPLAPPATVLRPRRDWFLAPVD